MRRQSFEPESKPQIIRPIPQGNPFRPIVPPLHTSTEEQTEQNAPPTIQQVEAQASEARRVLALLGEQDFTRQDVELLVWVIVSPFVGIAMLTYFAEGNWPVTLFLGAVLALISRVYRSVNALRETETALRLSQYDASTVGTLIDALDCPFGRLQTLASRTLRLILPRLAPENAPRLNARQQGSLYRRLSENHAYSDPELTCAILSALPILADENVLPYVENLADSRAWLPRHFRVRAAARTVLPTLEVQFEPKPVEQAMPQSVVLPDVSPQATKRAPANAAVQSQLDRLEEESRTHQQPGMRLGFLLASWCVIVPYTSFQFITHLSHDTWPEAIVWGLFAAGATQLHRLTLSRQQTEAMKELAKYSDVAGIGKLAEALEWPDEGIKRAAETALIGLLPRVNATDADLLDARQRGCLYRMLKMSNVAHHYELILKILKALEQIGDEAAVPYVERLANANMVIGVKKGKVRESARECLPALTQRAQENTVRNTLLRASSASEVASADSLLRPAFGTPDAPAEQLLRPSRKTN